MKVLFATKVWSGDLNKFLRGAFERKVDGCGFNFADRWLMINNGIPCRAVDDLRISGKKIIVADHAQETLDYFGLTEDSFEGGYVYSIAELVCLYLAKDFDYLVWVQGDCLLEQSNSSFAGDAIAELIGEVSTVAPLSNCNGYHDKNGLDHFFSDQCYVVKVPEYRQKIYGLTAPVLPEYPPHGGSSFERMVGRYLHTSKRYRKILTNYYVHHEAY